MKWTGKRELSPLFSPAALVAMMTVLLLLLVACGAATEPGTAEDAQTLPADDGEPVDEAATEATMEEESTPSPAPTESEVPATEAPATEAPVTEATEGAETEALDPLEQRVIDFVTAESGVAESMLTIVSRESREWRNSALGCERPGEMYMDVITEGWYFVVEADGEALNVHTNQDGRVIKICDQPSTDPPGDTMDEQPVTDDPGSVSFDSNSEQATEIAEKARSFLASESGLPRSDLALQRITPTTWRNSSLGCPQPGMMYMQVITPGYQVIFEANGETFYVHTDEQARALVLCDDPQPLDP